MTTFKILHSADWHIGQFKGPTENNVNLRSLDTLKCLEHMVNVARTELPDIACISGDIFHQEQIGPVRYSEEVLAASNIIEDLSAVCKLVIVMRGTPNHDGSGQFKVLEKMFKGNKKVKIVTTPQIVRTPIADFACIPGFNKQDFRAKFPGLNSEEENLQWTQYISEMVLGLRAQCGSDTNPAILMAHYTVPGCNMESGQTSFFTNFEPVIPREILQSANYDAVLLGHIHRPQQIEGLRNVYYAGAINSMNFNDEGQGRGFYIHKFDSGSCVETKGYVTPFRTFKTLTMTQEDIRDYLVLGLPYLQSKFDTEELCIDSSIVRVRYTCDSDQKKMLNIPALQSDLYACGAFYVADVEAEQMVDITNRGLLSEGSDPLLNLKKWLDEKCFKDTDKIVELAEPIIAEAMKNSSTVDIHGVFKPISIGVKNYRNYAKEHFDFEDITFCTINGQNGTGKSSLFMDAIVDCLFEDTREGDSKSWIRATEDARSGAIEFTFEIGDSTFRVVRTRTKSGKPTLNLSEIGEDGEWLNISKERIVDTQAEIIRILGMDAMTFKSCALIMQDQYGLFLQAKKDERIAILSNLLGLGIYSVMELDARKRLADAKRELAAKKEAVNIKKEFIAGKGNPAERLDFIEKVLVDKNEELSKMKVKREETAKIALDFENKIEKKMQLMDEYHHVNRKMANIEADIAETERNIGTFDEFLEKTEIIEEMVERYNMTKAHVDENSAASVLLKNEMDKQTELSNQLLRYKTILSQSTLRNAQICEDIIDIRSKRIVNLDEMLETLADVRAKHAECVNKKMLVFKARDEFIEKKRKISEKIAVTKTKWELLMAKLKVCKQQKEYIDNSNCPLREKAQCKFLVNAITEVAKIEEVSSELDTVNEQLVALENRLLEEQGEYEKAIREIDYSTDREEQLAGRIKELEVYEMAKAEQEEDAKRLVRLETEKESNDNTIVSAKANAEEVQMQIGEVTQKVDELTEKVRILRDHEAELAKLTTYVEQSKQIPLYKERKANAEEKLNIFRQQYKELSEKSVILFAKQSELDMEIANFNPNIKQLLADIDLIISDINDSITQLQIEKGALMQKVDDINMLHREITALAKEMEHAAELASKYEILKQAFSQDGVPHQIIRNIIPHITDVANNILGSMTSGTMGVEFVMEKTVKGKDGDKATLDVLINEYGKTTLPYASKSGGEKVKASLAVILALAEIKTSAAGIQLGMLFIDEPPFLDGEGTQAYVDSLETIRQRYPDVKVMAITHDEAMKARFAQSVTVVKSDDGSKVMY